MILKNVCFPQRVEEKKISRGGREPTGARNRLLTFPFDLWLEIVLMLMTRQHAQAEDFSKGPLQGVHHPHTGSRSEDFSSGSIWFSQTGEKTALYCLTQHDWKLDIALDNYFANPEAYYRWVFATQDFSVLIVLFCKGNLGLLWIGKSWNSSTTDIR